MGPWTGHGSRDDDREHGVARSARSSRNQPEPERREFLDLTELNYPAVQLSSDEFQASASTPRRNSAFQTPSPHVALPKPIRANATRWILVT